MNHWNDRHSRILAEHVAEEVGGNPTPTCVSHYDSAVLRRSLVHSNIHRLSAESDVQRAFHRRKSKVELNNLPASPLRLKSIWNGS